MTIFRFACVTLCVSALILALLADGGGAAASPPVVTTRPAVTGSATQGSRLAVSPGAWSGAGKVRLSYQWYRCDTMGRHCRLLHGVGTRGHVAGANDVGHTLSVAVRATDAHGSTRAFASLVGPIGGAQPQLDPLAQPVIAGAAVQGTTLRVDAGRWRPKPSSFAYQWARCNVELRACAAISGETHETHDVGSSDIGHVLVAIVQARAGIKSRAVFSTATTVATAAGTGKGPTPSAPPAVAVVLQQGHELTGSAGQWAGNGAIAYAYSWYRCDSAGAHCKAIRGATQPTHVQSARDVGHTLGFAVTATDTTGTTIAYAPLVGPVAAPDAQLVSTGPPTISGTAAAGQQLQVSAGSWSRTPTALGYQWQRCNANGRACAAIAGATAATYVTTADDGGHRLLALVHATAGALTQDVLSVSTGVVGAAAPAGPAASSAPAVAGTLGQGSQLTGSAGTWSGTGPITYGYNWYRCDAAGAHCLSIHGATKPTYKLAAKDVGHTLGFAVRATDANGTATSYATLVGTVASAGAPLASSAQPAITGSAAAGQVLQVSTGGWTTPPTAVTYQWQRCNANGRVCVAIPAANASSYTVTTADAGHTLLATVTGSLNGAQQAALSAHTALVP